MRWRTINLAAITERTRSEANKTSKVNIINEKEIDFLTALQQYRVGPEVIVCDDQKLLAIQKCFSFGQKVCQFTYLRSSAINAVVVEYFHLGPPINCMDNFSNRLVLSKITKEEAYNYASEVQDA